MIALCLTAEAYADRTVDQLDRTAEGRTPISDGSPAYERPSIQRRAHMAR